MRKIKDLRPIKTENGILYAINQLKLPAQVEWVELSTCEKVADAITNMVIRGAPLIGIVAAYGFAIGIRELVEKNEDIQKAKKVLQRLKNTRPTAVNLFWALERMWKKFEKYMREQIDTQEMVKLLFKEAEKIELEDYHANKSIGGYGQVLLPKKVNVLTHCNTGALATSGWGTALGVIRSAYEDGKDITVYVDETRPYLQGSRLTAWELVYEGIPHYLITDNSAGFLMKKGIIDAVIVGADRITASGDVANKIGTYSLSVLAKEHGIPFYVAAPTSTFDLSTESGDQIIIEERSEDEIKNCGGCRIAPEETKAVNYSFDITPASNITAIITEKGIISHVDREHIQKFLKYRGV
ncbi:methylthioribose-1-phosphate isomerase [Persephonella hydrogeniphila]|uniref:Methylthioribose-1-phosphate isomerase n=1 Tax=Persephonella hydrogeniphila TaxID=198703 RepID=A0A285NCA8_9AQUI|nr:S-methyl-5-thioribose-1-phosphate isomerase [Persephonella hydrogeniphila]SNZ07080.1 methylthioribose-1-phosphate isomerase [Persephonella hydrogeniphila]